MLYEVITLFSLEYLSVGEGLRYTSASHSVVFLYTAPIFAAIGLHWKLPEERLHLVITSYSIHYTKLYDSRINKMRVICFILFITLILEVYVKTKNDCFAVGNIVVKNSFIIFRIPSFIFGKHKRIT